MSAVLSCCKEKNASQTDFCDAFFVNCRGRSKPLPYGVISKLLVGVDVLGDPKNKKFYLLQNSLPLEGKVAAEG